MKKEIFEALKTKFPGVQDAILNRVAEKLAKTVTDADGVATAVEGVTFQQVLESYGDSRATEATQSAVTNYEKKHNLKDGAKIEESGAGGKPANAGGQSGSGEGGEEEPPKWAKGLIEQNKKLEERLASFEGEKVINSRLERLTTAMAKAPDQVKTRYTKDFNRMSFKDDEEFDNWLTEVETGVTDLVNDLQAKGAVFTTPKVANGGSGDDKPSEEVKARVERNKAETGSPAIKGLPETK